LSHVLASDLRGVFGICPKEANIGDPGFTNVIHSGMVMISRKMFALPNASLLEVFHESGRAVTAGVDPNLSTDQCS
jgi:hypothetical protein